MAMQRSGSSLASLAVLASLASSPPHRNLHTTHPPCPNAFHPRSFVCSIYVVDGVQDCFARFETDEMGNFGRSLLDLNLAILTFGLSVQLQGATRWRCLFPSAREFLADYAVTIGVVASTLCSYTVQVRCRSSTSSSSTAARPLSLTPPPLTPFR